jgi:hypothetical protein
VIVAKSPSEQIRDLGLEMRALQEREHVLRDQFADLKAADEKRREENEDLRHELALELRSLKERDATRERDVARLRDDLTEERNARAAIEKENAILKQQLQDHIKQVELWDNRRWSLIVLLIGTILSLASGLIVTLARK